MTKSAASVYPEKTLPEVVLEHRRRSTEYLLGFVQSNIGDQTQQDLKIAKEIVKRKKLTSGQI